MANGKPQWGYDAGEPWQAKKHRPCGSGADVRLARMGRKVYVVTACPKGLTQQRAEALLREHGIPAPLDPDIEPVDWPECIYAVLDGVPYLARPTVRGRSYHAFPMLPRDWERAPPQVRTMLEQNAANEGKQLADWFSFVKKRLREFQS